MKRTSWILVLIAGFFMLGVRAWAQPHPFCGIVTDPDGSSSVGIPNVSILLNPPPASGPNPIITDANGEFCTQLVAGTYTVDISAGGCAGYQTDLFMPDTNKDVVFSLQCPDTSTIFNFCGIITEIDGNGPPLDSVLVEILNPSTLAVLYTTMNDANGHFCINAIPGGIYKVRFSRPGYQTLVMDLTLDVSKFIVNSLIPVPIQ